MARDSKGQRVKAYKATVIGTDLKRTEEVQAVYFKADEGQFSIYLPRHYIEALGVPTLHRGKITSGTSAGRELGPHVYAKTLDDVMHAFDEMTEKYKELLKHQQKRKVILLHLKYASAEHRQQHRSVEKFDGFDRTDPPALAFSYTIAWDIAGVLYYYQTDDQVHLMRWGGRTESTRVIDWTAEREEFFARMKASLAQLVDMIVTFLGDAQKNPDAAIASFLTQRTLLPAPTPSEDK